MGKFSHKPLPLLCSFYSVAQKRKRKYVFNAELMKEVGRRIRMFRLSKGMTTLDLAVVCNTDTSQINRMELGKSNSSLTWISIVAEGLHVEITDLIPKKQTSK